MFILLLSLYFKLLKLRKLFPVSFGPLVSFSNLRSKAVDELSRRLVDLPTTSSTSASSTFTFLLYFASSSLVSWWDISLGIANEINQRLVDTASSPKILLLYPLSTGSKSAVACSRCPVILSPYAVFKVISFVCWVGLNVVGIEKGEGLRGPWGCFVEVRSLICLFYICVNCFWLIVFVAFARCRIFYESAVELEWVLFFFF